MRCPCSRSRNGFAASSASISPMTSSMSARGQIRVDRQLRGGQAQLLEPTDLRDRERLVRHVRQRIAAKQRQRLARRPVPRLARLGRPSRLGDQPFETADVHELAVDPQLIPTPARDDLRPAVPAQRPAQSPDVVLDHVGGARRWLLTPQPLDQPVGRDRTIRLEPQHRQNGALLRVAERDGVAVNAGLDGSKDAEPHPAPVFGCSCTANPITSPNPGQGSAGGGASAGSGASDEGLTARAQTELECLAAAQHTIVSVTLHPVPE